MVASRWAVMSVVLRSAPRGLFSHLPLPWPPEGLSHEADSVNRTKRPFISPMVSPNAENPGSNGDE